MRSPTPWASPCISPRPRLTCSRRASTRENERVSCSPSSRPSLSSIVERTASALRAFSTRTRSRLAWFSARMASRLRAVSALSCATWSESLDTLPAACESSTCCSSRLCANWRSSMAETAGAWDSDAGACPARIRTRRTSTTSTAPITMTSRTTSTTNNDSAGKEASYQDENRFTPSYPASRTIGRRQSPNQPSRPQLKPAAHLTPSNAAAPPATT